MKVAALILAMFLAAVSAAGQVVSLKNDIPESQYLAAEVKAAELLKKSNYRSVWTSEWVGTRSKDAQPERTLHEVIQPDKWRTVEERLYDPPSREEVIADGKTFYYRTNDGPWAKGGRGSGVVVSSESGKVTNQYRYLPAIEIEGKTADFYEKISDFVVDGYVRTTRVWYSAEGKILKKTEEIAIEWLKKVVLETTTYEYDPKDLKIEAPTIK